MIKSLEYSYFVLLVELDQPEIFPHAGDATTKESESFLFQNSKCPILQTTILSQLGQILATWKSNTFNDASSYSVQLQAKSDFASKEKTCIDNQNS